MIDIEKSLFKSLVFTTTGRMAPECTESTKEEAEKIAEKRKEPYASVMTYISTKAQICPFEEHPHCNKSISRQAK